MQQSEVGEEEIGHTEIFQNTKTDQEEPDATDSNQEESDVADTEQAAESSENPARKDPKNAKLLCLESGDMETLLGISFGDRIDYTRFEVSGSGDFGPLYCEIDARQGSRVYYCFQGKGHGFGGFSATDPEFDFLGLDQGEDKLERLVDLFGVPDEAGVYDKVDSIETVIWHFEKASLEAHIRNGYIISVEYLAADGVADGVEIPWEQTELAKDSQGNYDYLENIYQWEAICNSDANDTEASYHPYDDDYDAGYVGTFIQEYLKKQGIWRTEPDGTVYNRRGEPLVEYYIEEAENKYCFVVHLWGDYWLDYEAGTSEYRDAVYCTTHVLEESDQTGTLLYNIDEENGITRERLYDTDRMRKADVSYKNMAGAPISLITDYWYIDTGYDAGFGVLCRSHLSSWTHGTSDSSGAIEYDEKGRMILNDYYITHGGHTDIFLYKDDSDLPWACLNWCSYAPGFTNVYLFERALQ
ncbi:MAG: hypothetical protein HDR13_03475 [Lachnospiraceae bacterium]|nr:hypothetical protein [Lachnospiraceae bacterium]